MIDIYYPYAHELAKGEELRYSLRSLEQYANFEYKICIVGNPPEWVQNVDIIFHRRDESVSGTCTWDAIQKLKIFLAAPAPDAGEDFIRMYDDIYLLQPCSLDEMKVFYTQGDYTNRDPDMQNTWGQQLKRTLQVLNKKGLGQYNTETHLPEYFNKLRMRSLLQWFEPEKERLLTSTLYSNFWSLPLQPLLGSSVKAGFYGNRIHSINVAKLDLIRQACSSARYLNHNDHGYSPGMQQFLKEKFPNKSRFEK